MCSTLMCDSIIQSIDPQMPQYISFCGILQSIAITIQNAQFNVATCKSFILIFHFIKAYIGEMPYYNKDIDGLIKVNFVNVLKKVDVFLKDLSNNYNHEDNIYEIIYRLQGELTSNISQNCSNEITVILSLLADKQIIMNDQTQVCSKLYST